VSIIAFFSSVSAIINSLAAVCLNDFILPASLHFKGRKPNDSTQRWIAVGLGLFIFNTVWVPAEDQNAVITPSQSANHIAAPQEYKYLSFIAIAFDKRTIQA
jgi:hypothetical protein